MDEEDKDDDLNRKETGEIVDIVNLKNPDAKDKSGRSEDSDSDAQSLGGGRSHVRRNFWNRYLDAVNGFLADMKAQIDVGDSPFQVV